MKQFWSKLYIALCLALLLSPFLGMWALGPAEAAANQVLTPAPSLHSRDGSWNGRVLNDSADYLADHFALRQQLVSLWSGLNAKLLRSSPEEQVILGREGWLFFSETLDDYTGQALSDEELAAAAARLAGLQAECERRGARFLLVIVPNKNSLYPQFMPAAYPENHRAGNWEKLRPLLDETGVAYVDLFALPLPYYRTDTHWTAEGAAMAADRLLAALGRESAYAAGPFGKEQEASPGDLFEMLYPAGQATEETLAYTGELCFEHLSRPNGGNAITIRTSGEGEGSLFCWRDSFGVALYPYLASAFREAEFSRSTDYSLPEGAYDVVILELVERNLPQLIEEPTA